MPEDAAAPTITVLLVPEHPTSSSLLGSVRRVAGTVLLVSSPEGLGEMTSEHLHQFFRESRALNPDRKLILAIKDPVSRDIASKHGWQTVQNLKQLKPLLKGHKSEAEAVRSFSPVTWRQDIRSRLQAVGLLSLPKIRIWLLLGLSAGVFLFVFFKLLPSAEIRIWPDQETRGFTTNVYLAVSGAALPVDRERVRSLPLELLTVTLERTITYDQISKNFTGTNASMTVTVMNETDEQYSLRKGSRIVNQAGMRFRLQDDLILPAHAKQDARAVADPIDQYGEVLGERGNVPAGVRWDFVGLSEKERVDVYARNAKPGTGGATSYVTELTKDDIEGTRERSGARQRLEQELLTVAKQQIDEDLTSRNKLRNSHLLELEREELTKIVYKDFDLSEQFIGQNVQSIPLHGIIEYTVILYDENDLLNMMKAEVYERIPPDKSVVESSLVKENMDINVIPPWDDDFQWVKITAELTYTDRYVISPITPSGAKFGKYIRDNVVGKTVTESYRIIRNLPEVEKVEISVWPPWAFTLPAIGSSIAITEKEN